MFRLSGKDQTLFMAKKRKRASPEKKKMKKMKREAPTKTEKKKIRVAIVDPENTEMETRREDSAVQVYSYQFLAEDDESFKAVIHRSSRKIKPSVRASGYRLPRLFSPVRVNTRDVVHDSFALKNKCFLKHRFIDAKNHHVVTDPFVEKWSIRWRQVLARDKANAIQKVSVPILSQTGRELVAKERIARAATKRVKKKQAEAKAARQAYRNEQLLPSPLPIPAQPTIVMIYEKARLIMSKLVHFADYLDGEGFALREIEPGYLVVDTDTGFLPRIFKDALIRIPKEDEYAKTKMKRESFQCLARFFKISLLEIQPGTELPVDLAHFLGLFELTSTSVLPLRYALIIDHPVLKSGRKNVVRLKTIADRARGLMGSNLIAWEKVLISLNSYDGTWQERIKPLASSFWNLTFDSFSYGPEASHLLRCARNLTTHLCDTAKLSYDTVYVIIMEIFPELLCRLQEELDHDSELRDFLMA